MKFSTRNTMKNKMNFRCGKSANGTNLNVQIKKILRREKSSNEKENKKKKPINMNRQWKVDNHVTSGIKKKSE